MASRTSDHVSSRRLLFISILLSPWCLLCIAPLLLAYGRGLTQWSSVWTLDRTLDLAGMMGQSLLHAGAAALMASACCLPAARALSRTRPRTRWIALCLLCPALLIPVIIHTFSWLMAFGTTGWLSPLLGGTDLLRHPHLAVNLIWASAFAPISLIIQVTALSKRHRAGEELAQLIPLTLSDRIRIQWGYVALPALMGAGVMLLLMLFNSTAPAYFGRHFFANELMSEFSHPAQRDRATALALPIQIICLALLLLFLRLAQRLYAVSAYQSPLTQTARPSLTAGTCITLLALCGTILPLLMMLRESHWLAQIGPDAAIAAQDIRNTLNSTALTVCFALPLALSLYAARVLSDRSPLLSRSIDILATLTVTLPQSVLALALVLFWSQPDWRHAFYNSHLLHPLGLALILTPALYWCLRLSRITTPNRFHEAAELTGLSFFRRFWLIDLRAARHWLILGIGAVATAALGNLEASQLLSRAGGGTLSQLIARNLHYGRDASMASHCLILVSMIAGVALITLALLRLTNRTTRTS